MAIQKIIEVVADVQQASKEIRELFDTMLKQEIEAQKQTQKVVDGVDNIGKSTKATEKATKTLADGFKGVGLAIKAMGIGLVLEAFNILKGLFMSNQTVADGFATAVKALGIVFNDLFQLITENAPKVGQYFKDIFENPQKALKDFGNMIKDNIIERFESLLDMLGSVSSAFANLFKGDFKAALEDVKQAGKEYIDVQTGINNTFDRGVKFLKEGAEALIKYGEETLATASAMVQMENAAKLAAAQQARLVEQYDRQAEKLRQIRDNDLLSINDRIEANDKLAKVLDEQAKAMVKQADLQISAAKNNLVLNKNIENQVALTGALANKEGVLAQIEGFRSEQKANAVALEKELLDLSNTRLESETTLANAQAMFEATRNKDVATRLQLEKEALEQERTNELERLENKKNLYVEGTQARLEAEIEFNTRKQELDNALITKEDEIRLQRFESQKANLQAISENESESYATRFQALEDYNALILASDVLNEEQRTQALKENTEARKQLAEEEAKAKELMLQKGGEALAKASELLGESTASGKALAVAATTIDTYQSAVSAFKGMTAAIPGPVGIAAGAVAAAAATASGLATVKRILAVKVPSKGGGGGVAAPAGGAPTTATPQFNLVGNTGVNQIAATVGQDVAPQRAYVVSGDVTSAQSLDRNIVQNATIG